jgi:hypothetical protein
MTAMIDGLVFESSNYDADGDVLYLGRGESNAAADALLTSEPALLEQRGAALDVRETTVGP